MPTDNVVVSGLFVYPVKSCAGTALERAELGGRGIQHDREFMLVDPSGQFLTQRQLPRMALIHPTRSPDALELTAPGMPPLRLGPRRSGERQEVTVWRDRVGAIDQGQAAADWLSTYLGTACRLVRQADDAVRKVDPEFAREPSDEVSFADGFPLLLISEESLADLNARLEVALPMNRFRPNVVVRGVGEPYAEDSWRQVSIGGVRFSLVKACARCAVTTTDQLSAERGREPLATLATYRRVARGVLFGQNLIHHTRGMLRSGDAVQIDQPAEGRGSDGPFLAPVEQGFFNGAQEGVDVEGLG
ncbi:MAG: MOSC domain-containing protein [Chloroflexota bacterium]|nr:MOSC domain-containing protein [Chloroflexota bacterium]